jgi:hypothetical protein
MKRLKRDPVQGYRTEEKDSERTMDLKPVLRNHVNPGGFCVAATYVLVVVVVFAVSAYTTKPGNVGYDWIPFVLLAMPWYRLHTQLLLPGLIVNASLMYLLGTLLHTFWCRIIKQ